MSQFSKYQTLVSKIESLTIKWSDQTSSFRRINDFQQKVFSVSDTIITLNSLVEFCGYLNETKLQLCFLDILYDLFSLMNFKNFFRILNFIGWHYCQLSQKLERVEKIITVLEKHTFSAEFDQIFYNILCSNFYSKIQNTQKA